MTAEKVELGRRLFFDKRLSVDGSVSCATCHDPQLAFTDGKTVSVGVMGKRGVRNAPTLLDTVFDTSQFRDGRADTLESQAIMPLTEAAEMGNASQRQVVLRLRGISEYSQAFGRVFGAPPTIESLAKSIAAFERTLVSGTSRFDQFLAGQTTALGDQEQRGLAMFRGRARCSVCHSLNSSLPLFTDHIYRNTGTSSADPAFDMLARRASGIIRRELPAGAFAELAREKSAPALGRFLVTRNSLDIGAFKTPSLRNVELTAPYFHDGSAATLKDVVQFYVRVSHSNVRRDWDLQPIQLTPADQDDMIAFLKSLTSNELRRTTAVSSP